MMKTTVTVNGGASPKLDRASVMARAWTIFRETYLYPQIKFSRIGRACFGSALRTAWAEAREAARTATIPAVEKAARITVLNRTIDLARYRESWPQASHEINTARAEIARLSI